MRMRHLATIFGATLAVVATTSASVQAADRTASSTTQSITVSYADLDLSRQAGVDTLYRRILSAADSACSPKADTRDLIARRDWLQCVDLAVDNAVAHIANSTLSQTHLARTGRAVPGGDRIAMSK
jgi:UrcA family protein